MQRKGELIVEKMWSISTSIKCSGPISFSSKVIVQTHEHYTTPLQFSLPWYVANVVCQMLS